ncbi:hypothetical protein RJT34_11168 [Clitoria ternatea]|uniref:Uncharacterized protein n=1 Tax=Clitoria ternatea TaxID=43366 RepID=A0AAN9JJF5_CLITE
MLEARIFHAPLSANSGTHVIVGFTVDTEMSVSSYVSFACNQPWPGLIRFNSSLTLSLLCKILLSPLNLITVIDSLTWVIPEIQVHFLHLWFVPTKFYYYSFFIFTFWLPLLYQKLFLGFIQFLLLFFFAFLGKKFHNFAFGLCILSQYPIP